MPDLAVNNGKKPFPLRLIAQILIFSGLVALGLMVLWPVQRALFRGMMSVRDDLISRAESLLGRKIRYSGISPSIFGAFDVRNVRIAGNDDVPVLSLSRFRVSYSFLELLRGRPRAIRSVRIDAPVINVDLERDKDLIDLFNFFNTGRSASPVSIADILPERAQVRIRGGQCQILDGGEKYQIQSLDFNGQIVDGMFSFDGRWTAGFTIDQLVGKPLDTQIVMRINGAFDTGFRQGSALFSIASVTGDLLQMGPVSFNLALGDGVLSLRKQPDRFPYELSFDYAPGPEHISARFSCDRLTLRGFLEFSGAWSQGNRWLDMAGTGAASFERGQDGKVTFNIDLSGADPETGMSVQSAGASFEIRASGSGEQAAVQAFRFSMNGGDKSAPESFQGEISYRGSIGLKPLAPDGELSLKNVSFSGRESLSAELSITTQGNEISVFGDTARIGRVELTAFSAGFELAGSDTSFSFSALRFRDLENYGNVRLSSFLMEGLVNSDARQIEASLRLDSFSAGDISALAMPFVTEPPLPALLQGAWHNTAITTEVFFTTDFEHLLYNAPRLVIVYEGGRSIIGLISVSGTDQRFELSEGRFILDNNALLVSGAADFSSSANITFSMNANYRDLAYFFDGKIIDRHSINIQGAYGLNVSISANNAGGYAGFLKMDGMPIPYRGQNARLGFSSSLRWDSPDSWTLELERLECTGIATPAGSAQLRISGRADNNGVTVPLLFYSDGLGPLNGQAGITWTPDFSGFSGKITMEQGQERYSFEGSFVDNHLDLLVSGSRMRLDRVFEMTNNAFADGTIRVSWDSVNSFRAEFSLPLLTAKIQENNVQISAEALLDNNEFTVRNLRLNFADVESRLPLLRLSPVDGLARTRASIQGRIGDRRLEGDLILEADFKPFESWIDAGEALNSITGRARIENLRYGVMEQAENFDINFSRSGGALSVSGGPRNMLRLRIDRDGNLYAGLSSPFPVRGTLTGSISRNTINVRSGDLYVDLAELWKLLPKQVPDIELAGGYVNAVVDIRGSLADPEFFGTARGSSVRLRVPHYITQDIRPIPLNIAITGNEMSFGPAAASVGRGAGTVSGWFRFDRWIPNTFNIEIQVPRDTPVPFGFDITGFIARGDASGKLVLSMSNMILDISGDLTASNTEISVNADEINRARNMELFADTANPVTVNMNVTTGSSVEFLYPSSMPMLRAAPDMGTRVHVTADSLARQFSINSDVKIRSGEIFYFERSFYIRSGTLTFRENEFRFDPRLTARAEVRDRTADGPVTISMIADNAPLLAFTPRFESNPVLSQMEIFAMLGQSFTGNQIDETTGTLQQPFLGSLTDLAAQFAVVRQLERQVRNFMRLDMFSFRTQALQNALFYATGIRQNPVDRNAGVGNYFDNTTVFLGKYIGEDMFVQSMLSMRYDANKASFGGLSFEPDIGVELQSPLFNIRWDFVPTHPENWYVNDNSITLTWSKTF
ncbi:MAG: translocation/assembly module TamB domain-containing protein [Treponema sp.]|nr:translocation/assembly module TamB domain-containing protein [Treponema sp.]